MGICDDSHQAHQESWKNCWELERNTIHLYIYLTHNIYLMTFCSVHCCLLPHIDKRWRGTQCWAAGVSRSSPGSSQLFCRSSWPWRGWSGRTLPHPASAWGRCRWQSGGHFQSWSEESPCPSHQASLGFLLPILLFCSCQCTNVFL